MSEYTSVAENEKHATFWEDVAQKKKQREEAAKKQQEELAALRQETDRLAAELEMQKMQAEQEREAEAERKHQQQMAEMQKEKERLAAELARRAQQTEIQRQEYSYSPSDYEALKKTVYGHANREPREAQMGVAFVIMNRTKANQSYWGSNVHEVCHKPGQFWFGLFGDVQIHDWNLYNNIDEWLPGVMKGTTHDLTNGADHFLPVHDQNHDWLNNVNHVATYGNLNFYKAKWL